MTVLSARKYVNNTEQILSVFASLGNQNHEEPRVVPMLQQRGTRVGQMQISRVDPDGKPQVLVTMAVSKNGSKRASRTVNSLTDMPRTTWYRENFGSRCCHLKFQIFPLFGRGYSWCAYDPHSYFLPSSPLLLSNAV